MKKSSNWCNSRNFASKWLMALNYFPTHHSWRTSSALWLRKWLVSKSARCSRSKLSATKTTCATMRSNCESLRSLTVRMSHRNGWQECMKRGRTIRGRRIGQFWVRKLSWVRAHSSKSRRCGALMALMAAWYSLLVRRSLSRIFISLASTWGQTKPLTSSPRSCMGRTSTQNRLLTHLYRFLSRKLRDKSRSSWSYTWIAKMARKLRSRSWSSTISLRAHR